MLNRYPYFRSILTLVLGIYLLFTSDSSVWKTTAAILLILGSIAFTIYKIIKKRNPNNATSRDNPKPKSTLLVTSTTYIISLIIVLCYAVITQPDWLHFILYNPTNETLRLQPIVFIIVVGAFLFMVIHKIICDMIKKRRNVRH